MYEIRDVNKYLTTIEIDITENCNLGCNGCSRCCDSFKSNKYMEVGDIDKFINESIKLNYKWQSIMIIGGEPTIHPNLDIIIYKLNNYIVNFNKNCTLSIMTNNIIKYEFPDYITVICNSDHSKHHAFYVSPTDEGLYNSNLLCESINHCGMGYGIYGYTPCVLGSAMCRIFGYSGIIKLSDVNVDSLMELCSIYCKHCGWYLVDSDDPLKGPITNYDVNYKSKTWLELYNRYKNSL